MIEKTVVAVREQREILTGDGPLEFYRAPAHPLVQDLRLRLEVDDEIGFRSLRLQRVVYLLIEVQRSEEHTSELQSLRHLVCRLLLEKKNNSGQPGRTI